MAAPRRPERPHDIGLPNTDSRGAGHRVLVALFVVVISLPLAANLAGFDGADPGAENRELAPFPRIDPSWTSIASFPANLGLWFDDHFGFRSRLVRWYGESRLFLLGVSPSAAVVKGQDGWFFYGDDKAIEDYAQVEPMTPEELANWRAAVVRARDWVGTRAAAYVFTIAPDKHVIYPEEMPSTLARVGEVSRADQLFTTLQDTGLAVDVRPSLFEAKARERIYHQTDTHWNDRGGLVAYQRIIDAARMRVPATPPAWTRDDFEPVDRIVEGMDLAGMMGLTRVLREVDGALVPRRPRRARVVEPAGAAPADQVGRLVTEIDDRSLPRAVIFRDSFVSPLVPFLSEHFSRAVYLWQNDFDANAILAERPDVVIQEIVSRHLYNFIPSPELVPKP
jgi:alginate O-acetyltransferase complex protein AlgJ